MIECLTCDGPRPVSPLRGFGSDSIAAALEAGRLDLWFCADCHRSQFPPAPLCGECGGRDMSPVPASGRALLHSFTRIHAAPGSLSRRVPYPIGLVDLEEGVRLMLPLLPAQSGGFHPDQPMRLVICRHTDGPILAACPTDIGRAGLTCEGD